MLSSSSTRNLALSLSAVALLLAPAASFAQARPSISNVMPATVTAGVSSNLYANVNAGPGINFCELYVDLADVGKMNVSTGVASLPYTFASGGSHIAFVYCRYFDGSVNSGNETAIWVNGAITNSSPFAGGSSGSNGSNQNDSNVTSQPTPPAPPAPTTGSTGSNLSAPSAGVTTPSTDGTQQQSNSFSIDVPYGSLIKLACADDASADDQCHAVYYYGFDGMRHAFANSNIFFTWYSDFNSVVTVEPSALGSIPLGKNVTYRPGVRMVKFMTDPKVYAVSLGGDLRWIANEDVATSLYGADWNTKIDDLSDSLYGNYTFGADINSTNDYNPTSEMNSATKIDTSL